MKRFSSGGDISRDAMAQSMLRFSTTSSGLQQLRESSFTGDAVSVSRQGCAPVSQRKAKGAVMVNAVLLEGVSDHHSILGVSRGATKNDIKKAYRRLALEYHPDVCNGDHCSLKFQQITNAYEVNFLFFVFSGMFFLFVASSDSFFFSRSFSPFVHMILFFLCGHMAVA